MYDANINRMWTPSVRMCHRWQSSMALYIYWSNTAGKSTSFAPFLSFFYVRVILKISSDNNQKWVISASFHASRRRAIWVSMEAQQATGKKGGDTIYIIFLLYNLLFVRSQACNCNIQHNINKCVSQPAGKAFAEHEEQKIDWCWRLMRRSNKAYLKFSLFLYATSCKYTILMLATAIYMKTIRTELTTQ